MERRHRLTRGIKRWFILTGVFFVSFLETGTVRSFGIILNDLTSDFQASTAYIGTIIGMAHGATYWLSVLNTPLLRRFSVRQVVMAGGLIGSVGLILSALAKSGDLFAASLFMFGIGFSTVVLPANSSPVDYFPDLFEIASSINLTGGGIGLMLLPLLFEVFVTNYGWRGALMLLGAINLNTIVSGVLLEPIPKEDCVQDGREDAEAGRLAQKEQEIGECSASGGMDVDAEMDLEARMKRKEYEMGECSYSEEQSPAPSGRTRNSGKHRHKGSCSVGNKHKDNQMGVTTGKESEMHQESHGLLSHSLPSDGSFLCSEQNDISTGLKGLDNHRHIGNGGIHFVSANTNTNCKAEMPHRIASSEADLSNKYTSRITDIQSTSNGGHDLIASYNTASNSVTMKEAIAEEDKSVDDYSDHNIFVRIFHRFAKLFDLYLFVDYPVFFGICLATILFGVSYDGWVLFVIPNAEAKGYDSQMSVYIATAGGVGNIFGRFLIGFFTARKFLRNEFTYFLMNVMSSIAFFFNIVSVSFWSLSLLSFINGFSLGAKTSLQFIIVNGAVATHRYKAAVSMLLVSLGLGFPISGALLGGIYDKTDSYNISFCVIGFIDVICGFLICAPIILSCCRRWTHRGRREVPIEEDVL